MSVKVQDFKKDGRLWLVVHHEGRRHVYRAKSDDRATAEAEAELLRDRLEEGLQPNPRATRFGRLAGRYIREAMADLAETTREDRRSLLRPEGILGRHFNDLPADEITKAVLLQWAGEISRKKAIKTLNNYLDALGGVFAYAGELNLVQHNPVDEVRSVLRRRNRTKRGRSSTARPKPTPIQRPEELAAFTKASGDLGGAGHLVDLLCLDAGLRVGEASGLRWERIRWGQDADDPQRSLVVAETRPRGHFHSDTPKSGLERRVALSRRLRTALRDEWLRQGQPVVGPVFDRLGHQNYRIRHFRRACVKAKVGLRRPKDLRDTYACQLLTAGISLGYISAQLGHGDVAVTARHYATYLGQDGYQEPLVLKPGEVPADLLVRIEAAGKKTRRTRKTRRPTAPSALPS